jgi:transposase
MSLNPCPIDPVPQETARVARAAFPTGNRYMTMRDELGVIYPNDLSLLVRDQTVGLAMKSCRHLPRPPPVLAVRRRASSSSTAGSPLFQRERGRVRVP